VTPVALMSAAPGGVPALPGEQGSAGGKAVSGRPKMEKAKLTLYQPSPAAGGSKPGGELGSVSFQFNPKEVTIAKTAKWERKPATASKQAGPPQFIGPEPCKLTVEMFFDATGSQDGSVVEAVEQLMACCVPAKGAVSRGKPVPPLVVLHWGSISSFPAVVTSVSAKYTLFGGDGTPIRALCSVTMEEMPGEPWRQNPTSGGQRIERVHRVVSGDTLASVAFAEYGDPTQWRAVAAYNGIDDPMRIPMGTALLLPPAEELAVAR
jgi:nucleoid-associated protein YgaU